MKFRTEIEPLRTAPIDADARIVLLGSCFADNMGERLERCGFVVTRNPLGPLFNPASLATALERALDGMPYAMSDLTLRDGIYHLLDGAARYASADADKLLEAANVGLDRLASALRDADVVFLTLGTAYIYRLRENGHVVANCHKLPAADFERTRLDTAQTCALLDGVLRRLGAMGKRTVLTVSPVRHVADGLHANNLSKATLLLAVDSLGAEYFPAYEIVCDDLRDYRYYAADLKHPSDTAIEYIYEKFADTYFTPATKETVRARHAAYLRQAHRESINKL